MRLTGCWKKRCWCAGEPLAAWAQEREPGFPVSAGTVARKEMCTETEQPPGGDAAGMEMERQADSGRFDALFTSEPVEDPTGEGGTACVHEVMHTSSPLVAWYLCRFRGCHVVRKTRSPKSNLWGGVSYKTTWWLRP